MRMREKLTLEEKFALALELLKRERSLDEIRMHYRVSHTTAYKIRNAFLEGGRAALSRERDHKQASNLEARISALLRTMAFCDLRLTRDRVRVAESGTRGLRATPCRSLRSNGCPSS